MELGDQENVRRWALELRTPVEVCEDLAKALGKAAGEEDVIEALRDIGSQIEVDPVAVVQSGCSTAIQTVFLSNNSKQVCETCLLALGLLLTRVQESQSDDEGPLLAQLMRSLSIPCMDGLKSVLEEASTGKGDLED